LRPFPSPKHVQNPFPSPPSKGKKMAMKDFLVEQLVNLVSIPSVSGEEGQVLGYLEEFLTGLGIDALRQRVDGLWYNLLVNHHEKNRVVLAAHVDTVPPLNGLPPQPVVKGEAVWGLGACDDKAGVVILTALLERFAEKLEEIPVTFAFLVDEENQGRGSETLAREKLPPWGIVLEPTELRICTCEAGSLEVEFTAHGKMAHGSEAEEGENAIEKALRTLERLKTLSFLEEEDERLGGSLMNILQISGGDGTLRIPHSCRCLVDFSILPRQEIEGIAQEIARILEEDKVDYAFRDVSLPFEIENDSWIVKTLSRAIEGASEQKAQLAGMRSWTDAAHLLEAGTQAVVFGPGRLSICHTPQEMVKIDELLAAYKILERLLQGLS